MQNLPDFKAILSSRAYDPDFTPPAENILFSIQGETIGSLENFIVFSGLAKQGKSLFLTAAISSAITQSEIFTMQLRPDKIRPKIAYFDTESGVNDFYKHIDRIKFFSQVKRLPDFIYPYCTRPDSPKMQKRLILEHFNNNPDTSVLIIDGLLDLCMNYNDEVETRQLINWLKKISVEFKVLIITVLHTTKDGGQRLGHLGANTDRWAQSTLNVKKENDTFICESKYLRSSAGFTQIEIKFDKGINRFIQLNAGEVQSNTHFKYSSQDQHNKKLNQFFDGYNLYTYDEFITRIKEIEKRGTNYAKEYFKYLKDQDFIKQNINGLWHDNRKLF